MSSRMFLHTVGIKFRQRSYRDRKGSYNLPVCRRASGTLIEGFGKELS